MTGALLPSEANPTQAQTMDWFQGDKVRPGVAIIQHRYMVSNLDWLVLAMLSLACRSMYRLPFGLVFSLQYLQTSCWGVLAPMWPLKVPFSVPPRSLK